MKEVLKIKKKNETYLQIETDISIQMELQEHFQFEVEGAKWSPKVKAGVWDGKIRLFNLKDKTIYAGLFNDIKEFCKVRNYDIELVANQMYGLPGVQTNFQMEDLEEFINELKLPSKLEVRDYQLNSIYQCLLNKRLTVISPTGSGKSLIQYIVVRYLVSKGYRVLMIVPTVGLTSQMCHDFADYSSENGWDVSENVHQISAGVTKETDAPVVISTFQSIMKGRVSHNWYNSHDVVCVDECVHPDSIIVTDNGNKKISELSVGDNVLTFNEVSLENEFKPIIKVHHNISVNEQKFKVVLEDGSFIILTGNHKIKTNRGWIRTDELNITDVVISIK